MLSWAFFICNRIFQNVICIFLNGFGEVIIEWWVACIHSQRHNCSISWTILKLLSVNNHKIGGMATLKSPMKFWSKVYSYLHGTQIIIKQCLVLFWAQSQNMCGNIGSEYNHFENWNHLFLFLNWFVKVKLSQPLWSLFFRWKCICKAIKNVFDKTDMKIQMFPGDYVKIKRQFQCEDYRVDNPR